MPDIKFSNKYPYTDFHELNLDWIIKEVQYWSTKVGKTIQSIELTGTVGLVDTYTINYSDGSTSTFDVTNGNGILSVTKTGTTGLIDTYTISFSNGTTSTFTIKNGNGIVSIAKTGTLGLTDTYTITYSNGTSTTFEVTNGTSSIVQKLGSSTIDAVSQNALSQAIRDNTSAINGKVNVTNIFEIGSITIGSNGWTYSASTRRVRTKQGTTIFLNVGDKITLTDYVNTRMYIGWQLIENGTYGTSGSWYQQDFVAPQPGYYVMCLTTVPEATIADVDDITDLIEIIRCVNLDIKNKTVNSPVKAINHRGYSWIAPENTIPAFALSKQMGFEWVETDVSFTSDNIPVLLHDNTIDRTSDGTGNIADMTYAQVRTYDFGSWKNPIYTGTKIPSLEEFLIFCKRVNLNAFLELKSSGTTEANVLYCIDLVRKTGMIDHIVWISYADHWLTVVKNNLPSATLGYLSNTITPAVITAAASFKTAINKVFVDSPSDQFTDSIVEDLIDEELYGGAFTLNLFRQIRDMNPYIEYVTTDTITVPEALLNNYL